MISEFIRLASLIKVPPSGSTMAMASSMVINGILYFLVYNSRAITSPIPPPWLANPANPVKW
jgi:hypothetical protein